MSATMWGAAELVAPMPDVALIVGANSAAMDERIKALVKQLDSFRSKDLFLKRFRMLGRNERRRGGVPPTASHAAVFVSRLCDRRGACVQGRGWCSLRRV